MCKEYEKLLTNINPIEPPTGLFNKIILAIKREQELQQTRKILFSFLFFLIVSLAAMPFSTMMLASQIQNSGIFYFFSTAFGNFGTFLALWQDFCLAILESLPITGITAFVVSMSIALFTLRLFLCRKKLLLNYLKS